MKNKKIFLVFYTFLLTVTLFALIIFYIFGNIERKAYLSDFKLNKEKTFGLSNTIFYVYNFKIKYYSKVFKNSDIYGVYPKLDSIPTYVKRIKFDELGSPFGSLISTKKLTSHDKIENVSYVLKVKRTVYFVCLSFFIIAVFLYYGLYFLFKISKRMLYKIRILCSSPKYAINIFNSILDRHSQDKLRDFQYECDIKIDFFMKFFISLLLTMLSVFILKYFKLSDVKIYAVSLALIFVYFYFLSAISVKKYDYIKKIAYIFFYDEKGKIINYIIILFFLISLGNTFLELKAWNYFPLLRSWYDIFINRNIFIFLEESIVSILLFCILIKFSNNYTAIFLSVVSVILIVYQKYSPAIFDFPHHTAHFNSAFMIHNAIPYQKNMYSIIGHYALLMEPFFKIFGLNVKTYSILIAILSGISSVCVIITIFFLIKPAFYRILGVLITLFLYFTINYNYYQVLPIRVLFTSIMILYVSIIGGNKKLPLIILGYFFASFAILWNAETGLICLAALFFSNLYVFCYDLSFRDKRFYFQIALFSLLAICSIGFSIVFLNVCNIYLGGEKQGIKDLLFPLLTGQVNYTEIKLSKLFNYWFITILLFLIPLIYFVKDMNLFNFRKNSATNMKNYTPALVYCSISALGAYSYYINRSAFFNAMIIIPMVSIMLPFILYKLHVFLKLFACKKINNCQFIKNITLTIFIIGFYSAISLSVNNISNIWRPVNPDFYNYMSKKNDEKNGVSYIMTEYMKKYGYNGISSFGGAFVYGYANLGWTNSLILPNESDWWNPSFGYSNAFRVFLDIKPDLFFSSKTLSNASFYYNEDCQNSVNNYNEYINFNYTNLTTEYEINGLYMYKLKNYSKID